MRILGVDFGEARIGIAVSDPLGFLASGVGNVLNRNFKEAAREVAGKAQELGAEKACIRDKEVCAKVEKLERHTRQIAAWLKQHPDKEASVRRFSGYYLPTVLKLLRTYNEVEQHAGDSSVASGIQQEIGDILETIDKAFVTLHDGLLEDTALNVSAEISALETVLAQDGLVQDGMAGQ